MADPVAVAIKQEAATRALNETIQSFDKRLARIEEHLAKPGDFAAAQLIEGPDVIGELTKVKQEILAAFIAKAASNSGPVNPPKGK